MARDTTANNTLPISQVFKSSWVLVCKHILFWLALVVVLHFISWKFVIEMGESLKKYIEHIFGSDVMVKDFLSKEILKNVTNKDLIKIFGIISSHFTLLQVVVSQLIYDWLGCRQQKPRPSEIFQRFRTIDFLFDVLRTIGIITIYYGIFLGWFIVNSFWAVFFSIVATLLPEKICSLITTISDVGFLIFFIFYIFLFMGGLALAVPVTVVENKKILKSLDRSWRMSMTASGWIKMPIVVVLTVVLTLAFFVLLILAYEAYEVLFGTGSTDLFLKVACWSCQVFGTALLAIVMSVCYCYLRRTEDGDKNPL